MTHELNKELLKATIADWEAAREEIPFGLGEEGDNTLAALKFALAAYEQEPVSFDELRAAVFEMTGGRPTEWSESTYKGHQVVPFINFNSLSRIVEKFRTHPAPSIPAAVPDEQAAFEAFMERNFRESIDRRKVKNGDGEYFAWDMQVAWKVWQERAAAPKGVPSE